MGKACGVAVYRSRPYDVVFVPTIEQIRIEVCPLCGSRSYVIRAVVTELHTSLAELHHSCVVVANAHQADSVANVTITNVAIIAYAQSIVSTIQCACHNLKLTCERSTCQRQVLCGDGIHL